MLLALLLALFSPLAPVSFEAPAPAETAPSNLAVLLARDGGGGGGGGDEKDDDDEEEEEERAVTRAA